ncbi:MAG: cell wall hydrolase, partial [Pseudomonadota bacterium]
YYEARSESLSGQLAVAEVIANRVKDARYPNTICEVVYQGSRRNIGCQFTFTCDGALNRKPRGVRWQRSKAVAAQVVLDLHEPRTAGATHYHANYVDPIWNAGLVHTKTIGTHIFYRFPRGKEWGIYRARLAEKRANRRRVIQTVADTAPAASEGVIVDATAAPAP